MFKFKGKVVVALTIEPGHLSGVWLKGGLYSATVRAHFQDGSKPKRVPTPQDLEYTPPGGIKTLKSYDDKDRGLRALFENGNEIVRSSLKGGKG